MITWAHGDVKSLPTVMVLLLLQRGSCDPRRGCRRRVVKLSARISDLIFAVNSMFSERHLGKASMGLIFKINCVGNL